MYNFILHDIKILSHQLQSLLMIAHLPCVTNNIITAHIMKSIVMHIYPNYLWDENRKLRPLTFGFSRL